jgi:hypothetical protein
MVKKFRGSLDALMKMGTLYVNQQRFTPLHGEGRPLWEFKEFDHRLYCHRHAEGNFVRIVLLSGWVKEKKGRTEREDREIQRAQDIYAEYLSELSGGK